MNTTVLTVGCAADQSPGDGVVQGSAGGGHTPHQSPGSLLRPVPSIFLTDRRRDHHAVSQQVAAPVLPALS